MEAIQVTNDVLDHPWGLDGINEQFSISTLIPARARGAARVDAFSAGVGLAMSACLERMRPDILFLPGWSHPSSHSGLEWCLKNSARPVVMSESTRADFPRVWWREAYKKFVVQSCFAALAGGRPHRDYLIELGMSPESISLGYDVVDNDYFATGAAHARANAADVRTELALPERYFLASNRFIEKKNLLRLVQAYDAYRRQAGAAAWHLVMLGDGEMRPRVESLVRDLHLEGLVQMPGFASYDVLPKYLGLASAFVHASTMEQWGLVVNEAMATGLPVLVSDRCGCATDLVEAERNGELFDPFDVDEIAVRLARMAGMSPDERAAMGERSRAIIANWSPARFGRGVVEASRRALDVKPNRLQRQARRAVLASTARWSSAVTAKLRA